MNSSEYTDKKVRQVRCDSCGPTPRSFVGREGTVDMAITDDNGIVHVHTQEDDVWCPARLVELVTEPDQAGVPTVRTGPPPAGTPEAFKALVTRMAPVVREAAVLGFSEQDVMAAAKQAYFRVA